MPFFLGRGRERTIVERDGIPALVLDLAEPTDDDLVPLGEQLLDHGLLCQLPAHLRELGVESGHCLALD